MPEPELLLDPGDDPSLPENALPYDRGRVTTKTAEKLGGLVADHVVQVATVEAIGESLRVELRKVRGELRDARAMIDQLLRGDDDGGATAAPAPPEPPGAGDGEVIDPLEPATT